MIASRLSLALAVLVGLAGPLSAQTSTSEGAAALTAAFQRYLSDTPGVVTVSPTGTAYKVVIDAAPLAARAGGADDATMSPLELVLTDRGDGSWGVAQDQPFALDIDLAGNGAISLRLASVTLDGVWDPELATFTSYTGTATGFDYVATLPAGPDLPPARTTQTIATMAYSGTGAANPAGGVDLTQDYDARGISQTMPIPEAGSDPGNADPDITISIARQTGSATASGLRSRELLDLAAFAVANPSQAAITAAQDDLRTRLGALMPVFALIEADFTLEDVDAATPAGTFGLRRLGAVVTARGAVADGYLREAFSFEGIKLPPGLVPDWAVPLIPERGSIDIAGTGFDLAAVAARAIAGFDLTRDPPVDPATEEAIAGLILPTGQVTITFAPSEITGTGYRLAWDGQMLAGPVSDIPTGRATITATGLDAVRQALIGAPPDIGGPASMGIGAAVAVGRISGDTVTWDIDATTPGQVLVNGRPLPTGLP